MSQDQWLWSNERTLPSELAVVPGLIEEVAAHLDEYGWEFGDSYAVQLALEEGLSNAIRHGNRFDPAKRVRLTCQLSGQRVRIVIADEGPGFQPEEVPDPTADENLEKPGGRGLLLMRAYMNHVEYAGTGNVVVMEKDRAEPE